MNKVLFLVFLCVQIIHKSQDFLVFRDVAHAVPIMDKASHACFIDQDLGGHPPQFEQVDFLSIKIGNYMF